MSGNVLSETVEMSCSPWKGQVLKRSPLVRGLISAEDDGRGGSHGSQGTFISPSWAYRVEKYAQASNDFERSILEQTVQLIQKREQLFQNFFTNNETMEKGNQTIDSLNQRITELQDLIDS